VGGVDVKAPLTTFAYDVPFVLAPALLEVQLLDNEPPVIRVELLLLLLLLLGPPSCLTWLPRPRLAVVLGGLPRARGSPAHVFCGLLQGFSPCFGVLFLGVHAWNRRYPSVVSRDNWALSWQTNK
jgi:hypothetical protein